MMTRIVIGYLIVAAPALLFVICACIASARAGRMEGK